jgi:tetratricopeptide (TPR) repeat protein
MRLRFLAYTAAAACLAGPAAIADATTRGAEEAAALALISNPQVCGQADSALSVDPVGSMIMAPGFGASVWTVDATPEAQAWFDHGVRLRWAFEHKESVRAFRKARALDPTCGMCAWGEAWALGPNLNGGGNDDESLRAALRAAREARRLARDATPAQKQMIDALIQRYSGAKSSRSVRFARSMDRIARANPDDIMVAAATADAWMLNADEWWDKDGKAADPGITRAMQILESGLASKPDDPGAIHLYIHLTEWSDDPHKAIPYGERLALLAPGASHLVHMPSHTYFRVGRYRDAMNANVEAVALDKRYVTEIAPPGGILGKPLHAHNIHFGMGGALMAGAAGPAIGLADGFLATYPDIPVENAWRQVMANDAYAIYGRFADQSVVAALKEPPEGNILLRASWRYARGEAAARRGDAAAVRREAEAMTGLVSAIPDAAPMAKEARDFIALFQHVLEGRAAMISGDHSAAIAAYGRAAAIQGQGEEGGDPPMVWYPTRRSLAAALLASGDAAGAKAKVEELLKDWPSDPYSYFVLAEAEAVLGNPAAAAEARRQSRIEWLGGEMSLGLA